MAISVDEKLYLSPTPLVLGLPFGHSLSLKLRGEVALGTITLYALLNYLPMWPTEDGCMLFPQLPHSLEEH